jgi:5-deoxy-D-glucuronate isomerase
LGNPAHPFYNNWAKSNTKPKTFTAAFDDSNTNRVWISRRSSTTLRNQNAIEHDVALSPTANPRPNQLDEPQLSDTDLAVDGMLVRGSRFICGHHDNAASELQ